MSSNDLTGGSKIKRYFCTYRDERRTDEKLRSVQYIHFSQAGNILSECTHVLITIPPILTEDLSNYSDPVLDNPFIMENLPNDLWIGYVSTTGVYGNHKGSCVNESSPTLCRPKTKAFAYLDVEKRWQQVQRNSPNRRVFIFRCAGLYGDKSSALHTIMLKGIQMDVTTSNRTLQNGITSRIHLIDASRAIISTMGNTQLDGGIYNLADSCPEHRSEVMNYAKHLLCEANITVPFAFQITTNTTSERNQRRVLEQKIVSNEKMLLLLDII
jgi:hypothetical protein